MKKVFAAILITSIFIFNITYAEMETESYFNAEGTLWSIDSSNGAQLAYYHNLIYLCGDGSSECYAFTVSDYNPRSLITKFTIILIEKDLRQGQLFDDLVKFDPAVLLKKHPESVEPKSRFQKTFASDSP